VSTLSDKLSVPNSNDEIAELTVSFNKMTDRIQEAFLFQQQFSGNVAHELRTPLTIMKTKIDVFEKRENHTSAEYKELIENQKNQLMRLSEIIQILLEITNTDNVQEKEHFLVSDMIENILLDFSNMTAQKNICIATDLQNVEIYGNVDLLYRAFSNLIQNSIRYNVKNGDIYISAKQK
ncbi:two-component sensor histidine kinase, partial [Clostridioides difficile]|nr:two-component sensor histidine kinase [Clostridioides difficile]